METNFFIDKGKTGLANLGATCYLNTTIQCLGYCIDFLRFIISTKHKTLKEESLINELRDLYIDLWINNNSLIPRRFINKVRESLDFEIHQQNDINEFLSLFITKLNSDICYDVKMTKEDLIEKNKYSSSLYDVQRFKMDNAWLIGVGKEYSELIDLLYGQSIMQIICGNCNKITHNYEIYMSMMLPITPETNSITDCIREYMSQETLNDNSGDESNIKWRCDECKCQCKSKKVTKLWRNPKILIISLKRFTENLDKNNKQIDIPETVDITEYTLTKKRCVYQLTSVAIHYGSFFGGHYIAVCKHPDDNWYLIDDLSVNKLDTNNAMQQIKSGYVFFYTLKP